MEAGVGFLEVVVGVVVVGRLERGGAGGERGRRRRRQQRVARGRCVPPGTAVVVCVVVGFRDR